MKYKNIEAERARQGISIEQLASLLGISRKTFYNWRKRGAIPESVIAKMSVIFNCSTDYLAEHDEETFSKVLTSVGASTITNLLTKEVNKNAECGR